MNEVFETQTEVTELDDVQDQNEVAEACDEVKSCRDVTAETLAKKSLAEDPDQGPLSTMLEEEFSALARQRGIY